MEAALARIAVTLTNGMGWKKQGGHPFEMEDFMPYPIQEAPEETYATKDEIMALFPIRKPN